MQKRSIYSTLVYGAAVSLAGKFLGAGLQFVSQILLARNLGPSDYGLYSVGWGFFQIVGVIATFGLDYAIIKFGSEFWDDQLEKIKSLFIKFNGLSILLGGGAVIFVFLGISEFLSKTGRNDLDVVFKLFSIAIPFFIILRVNTAATRITQNLRHSAVAEDLTRKGVQLVLLLYIAQLGMRLEDTIIVTVISFAAAAILITASGYKLFVRNVKTDFMDGIDYRGVLKYSLFVTGSFITSSGLLWFDRIILGFFRPASEAGLYQAASQVTFLFSTILLAVNMAVAPLIASRFHKKDFEGLANIFRFSTKYIIYLGIPLALVVFIFPKLTLVGLYRDDYLGGETVLILLTITQVINIGTGAVAQVLLMTGQERKWFWFTLSAFVVNVTANLILVPRFGGVGAAIGSGISLIGLNIVGLFSAKKIVGAFPYHRNLLKGFAAALITTSLLLFLSRVSFEFNLISLVGIIITAYLAFGLSMVLFGIDDEDSKILDTLRTQLLNNSRQDS